MVHTALLSHHWSEILAYTKSYYISYSYICLFYFLALTGLSHTMWYFFVTTSAQTLCSGSENPLKREKLKRTAPDKPQWDCGKSWPTLTGEKNSCGSVHVKLSHVQLQCLKKKKKVFLSIKFNFFIQILILNCLLKCFLFLYLSGFMCCALHRCLIPCFILFSFPSFSPGCGSGRAGSGHQPTEDHGSGYWQ